MDYGFSSKEELFKRVKPALYAKSKELERMGYFYIQEVDIWNYLIEKKWRNSCNLMLSDIVNDILHVNNEEINNYLKGKLKDIKRTQYFENKLEIL